MIGLGASPLWLFDIDGTLVRRRPGEDPHGQAMVDAASLLVGRTLLREEVARIAGPGMTDWNILVLAVEQETGCSPTDADIARGLDFAARRYPELLAAAEAPLALDGAREIRGALLDRKHVVSLVTGNVEAIAEAKLAAADLSEYCSPQQGGFGDQSRLRPELVRIAVARARGAGWAGEQVAVVGDTPRDIDCAHANGSLAVAVTTGPYGRDALGAADLVIDSLAEILMLLDG